MKRFLIVASLISSLVVVAPAYAWHCAGGAPDTLENEQNGTCVLEGQPTPVATPTTSSSQQATTQTSTQQVTTDTTDRRVAVCHNEDSQVGMDSVNGVQSVQPRKVEPMLVSHYLAAGDWLMPSGGNCGTTVK